MKKIIIIAAALIGISTVTKAQNASGTAQQSVQLGLSNALEITFVANSSATGATVSLPFTTADDYANGVVCSYRLMALAAFFTLPYFINRSFASS